MCAAHLFYEDEPKFIYGNRKALELWELDYDSFVGMPSKFTAEAEQREARQKLLDEVSEKGFIKNYAGFRVSSTGRKFVIRDAIVWNLLDQTGKAIGQAVRFSDYEYL